MEKKKVSVQIEGRGYSLITDDDEKYVRKVAEEVTKSIRAAAGGAKTLDTRDCAVLAALNFCDERNKAVKKNRDSISNANKIIQQSSDLNRQCAEYREKLTEAINENTLLTRNNKELEKKLTVLRFETEQLKKKLKKYESDNGAKPAEASKSAPKTAHNGKTVQNGKSPRENKNGALNVFSDKAQQEERERRNKELLGYVPMKQYSLFDEDKSDKHSPKR